MHQFEGKVALVTGASSGIGQTIAVDFARAGAKVAICSRRVPEDTLRMIEEVGGEGFFVQTDISQADQVKALIEDVVEKFGRLDYAVNNAGYGGPPKPLTEFTEEEYDKTVDTNLKGVWLSLKYEIKQMQKQETGGAIVNISSIAGLVGVSFGIAPYTASKHGVIGLTKAAALEYGKEGIRVNAICPAVIDTSMIEDLGPKDDLVGLHPIGRIGYTKDVAPTALWLCSDESSFITGQALAIDGGWTAQ